MTFSLENVGSCSRKKYLSLDISLFLEDKPQKVFPCLRPVLQVFQPMMYCAIASNSGGWIVQWQSLL